MIRRSTADGSDWLLIHQVDHARLSAGFAACWQAMVDFGSWQDREALLAAILHHDDGWRECDLQSNGDPESGAPRAFNEMAIAESNAIWTESILSAAAMGPLTAYIVAQHFLRMRQLFTPEDTSDSTCKFVERFEAESERWLRRWTFERGKAEPDRALADLAVDYLQFFDKLSLLLCLNRMAVQLSQPSGPDLELVQTDESVYSIVPWPLTVVEITLAVPALRIPATKYSSAKQMKQAAVDHELVWKFRACE
ncbi:MAG: DUF3891 family protein [Pirellulaceae bacterium]|nr:DUF3891 family protein [Pirellulaceae bacterium]